MKKLTAALSFMVLFLGMAGGAMAYTIVDDATGGDCTSIGIWDAGTKTCTLNRDIWYEKIEMSSNVTLDGNSHAVREIVIVGAIDVTAKNLYIGRIDSSYSENIVLSGNVISGAGIYIHSVVNITIFNNTFLDCWRGIHFYYSGNSQTFNNNFINNTYPIVIWGYFGDMAFNLDQPAGGNYFSNYDSPEEGCTDSNSDGFCDNPYYFDGKADYLPLTTPIDITAPNTVSEISGECCNEICFSDVTVTLTARDYVSGIKEINYTIDGGQNITVAGDTASILLIGEGMHTIVYFARDNIGNIEFPKSLRVNIDKSDVTPPSVSVTASPNILWPPDHKLVDVMIDGFAVDDISGISSVNIYVTDEYGEYNLNVPDFGSGIRLESWREGKDSDGRHYTITVVAIDRAGNQTHATTEVIVPHDLKK